MGANNKLVEEDVQQNYPWYEIIETSETLEQGDFIDNCEIFIPTYIPNDGTATLSGSIDSNFTYKVEFGGIKCNVVIVSQSCDLGNNKNLIYTLVCPRKPISAYIKPDTNLNKLRGDLEQIRKGQQYRYFMLHQSTLPNCSCETQIVDLANVHSIPYNITQQMAKKHNKRLRLCSPYKEKLAQAFGYYFMRIGLPIDVPEIKRETLEQALKVTQ